MSETKVCDYCGRSLTFMGFRWTHYAPNIGGYVTHPEHPVRIAS